MLCSRSPFLSRGDAADAIVVPFVVVNLDPLGGVVPDLFDIFKEVLPQPVVAHRTVVPFT